MPRSLSLRWLAGPLLLLSLSGCMTYGGYDKAAAKQAVPPAGAGPLRYSLTGNSLLNGDAAIRQVFDHDSGFGKVEQVEPGEVPSGRYVRATVENVAPSVGSGISMYVSYATLFILPAWSTQDGSRLLFDVYRDGNHLQRFEYQVERKTFVWLPMVLFAWVNLLTPSESEAFEAITRQFLREAQPLLAS